MTREAGSASSGIRLSDQQRLNWLRLIRSDNVGPASFRELIAYCGTAGNALQMLPELSRNNRKRPIRIHSIDDAERELEAIAQIGAKLIGMGEPDYPTYLKQCHNPPPMVIAKGDLNLLKKPPVAIVGARNASVVACSFTRHLVQELAQAGFAIVSGLARGIDTAAHQASLNTGTIAVMAGGLNKPYPPENLNLFHAIPENGGVVITEMPMGWTPRAQDFPRRNRIIAGLSLGLAVIEAAQRSGSLISARLAGEMGRLVFAVPGSPLDPRANGTNSLLKNGAIMLTEASDIIEAIRPMLQNSATAFMPASTLFFDDPASILAKDGRATGMIRCNDLQQQNLQLEENERYDQRQRIHAALSTVPVSPDAIIRHTGLAPAIVHLALLELDMAGLLLRSDDGLVAATPENTQHHDPLW